METLTRSKHKRNTWMYRTVFSSTFFRLSLVPIHHKRWITSHNWQIKTKNEYNQHPLSRDSSRLKNSYSKKSLELFKLDYSRFSKSCATARQIKPEPALQNGWITWKLKPRTAQWEVDWASREAHQSGVRQIFPIWKLRGANVPIRKLFTFQFWG